MLRKFVRKAVHGVTCFKSKRNGALYLKFEFYHSSRESHGEVLPFGWYEETLPKITKLTDQLHAVDFIDGKLVNINDNSIIINDYMEHKMHTLKSLVRVFIGSPMVQKKVRENMQALSFDVSGSHSTAYFSKSCEREPMVLDSLTKVSNFLNVSAQQRKVVRFTICPQVTEYRIWMGALEEIINGLKSDMDSLDHVYSSKGSNMGQQIIVSCLKLLAADVSDDQESNSWMRPVRNKKSVDSPGSGAWEDVLDMFIDLIGCLKSEKAFVSHVTKLEVMKEGLSQIKDVSIGKGIGYREAQRQESLVQKKLSKTLGHSSRCLFTLLMYYLFGYIRDIEVDICGGISSTDGGNTFCLRVGRVLTSDAEKMVWNGVKQLDRALGLCRFIWETAGMKGILKLQGHLWCVGAKDRTLTYKRNSFFIHGISL